MPTMPMSTVPSSTFIVISAPRWNMTVMPGTERTAAMYRLLLARDTGSPQARMKPMQGSCSAPLLGSASLSARPFPPVPLVYCAII